MQCCWCTAGTVLRWWYGCEIDSQEATELVCEYSSWLQRTTTSKKNYHQPRIVLLLINAWSSQINYKPERSSIATIQQHTSHKTAGWSFLWSSHSSRLVHNRCWRGHVTVRRCWKDYSSSNQFSSRRPEASAIKNGRSRRGTPSSYVCHKQEALRTRTTMRAVDCAAAGDAKHGKGPKFYLHPGWG